MRRFRTIAILSAALWLSALPLPAAPTPVTTPRPGLTLHRELPRDPLAVLGIYLEDPQSELDQLIKLMDRFAAPVDPTGIDVLDTGFRLETILPAELVRNLGPELVLMLDLPPLDDAVAALQETDGATVGMLLGRSGLVATVRDERRTEQALRALAGRLHAEIEERDGLVVLQVPVGGDTQPAALGLVYRLHEGRLAFGFSEAWVHAALAPRTEGERLIDGADFTTVFANLDEHPTDLTYINLPKLYAYVTESRVIQTVLQTDEEAREFVGRLFSAETMGVGLGSTSVHVRQGVRMTNFGPPWMSGAAMSGGLLTALAVPNLMVAAESGKADRTLTDIESIGRACEGFSTDSNAYPGPTRGWVPVESIAAYLEPVYIGQLPRHDAWHNPLMYWSNGGSYRIISMGKDGRMDRDWSDPRASTAGSVGDIVYGDGRFLASPGAASSD